MIGPARARRRKWIGRRHKSCVQAEAEPRHILDVGCVDTPRIGLFRGLRRVGSTKILLVALLASAIGCATHGGSPIEEQIRNANTPAAHQFIADYYRDEAETMRQQSREHRRLASLYDDRHNRGRAFAVRHKEHCERLSEIEEEAATEYDLLALQHVRLAGQ